MVFRETAIAGAWEIEVDPSRDGRGLFARTFDADAFAEHGLSSEIAQCSTSFNALAATLRGLHYQSGNDAECKLVRCTAGAVFDVLVDLRPDSPSFRRWHGAELSAERRNAVYVPRGVAHGFQTLVDAAELFYMIDRPFVPGSARGVRWDDSAFTIDWPDPPRPRTISERDRSYPDFSLRPPPDGATSPPSS
jgi:dTDP-4-dehydrorhamnose 3,5-epimerase